MAVASAASRFSTYNAVSCISVRAPCATSLQTHGKNFVSVFPSSLKGASLKEVPTFRSHSRKLRPRLVSLAQQYLVKKVNAEELDKILDGDRKCPVVVDFYATWCGPCILLAQELELLAVEYGDTVKFVKVDTDEEYELASEMQIRGLPTLIFVSKDNEKNAIRTEGLIPSDVIRDIIENEL